MNLNIIFQYIYYFLLRTTSKRLICFGLKHLIFNSSTRPLSSKQQENLYCLFNLCYYLNKMHISCVPFWIPDKVDLRKQLIYFRPVTSMNNIQRRCISPFFIYLPKQSLLNVLNSVYLHRCILSEVNVSLDTI